MRMNKNAKCVNYVTFTKKYVTLSLCLTIPFRNILIEESMKKAGIVIFIAGLVLTIFTTFTIFTREKVVDIGEVTITKNKPHRLTWSPLIGVGVMAIGGITILLSSKKKNRQYVVEWR